MENVKAVHPRARLAGPVFGLLFGAGLTAMATAPLLAQSEPHMLGASLFGANEVGHEGAGDEASGDFTGEIDMDAGTLCYFLDIEGLDDVAAAHVHKGKKGKNGPPVVVLQTENPEGEELCVEVESEVLADIAKNEDDYYVNVHTASIPAGAIRGQFGG